MLTTRLAVIATLAATQVAADTDAMYYQSGLTYGVRPGYLVSKMKDGPLKDEMMACLSQTPETTKFSIGHRGAPLMFPEHTAESNRAAAAMGAGVLECDVTFTSDKELVCRHAQNDLHTTTNILTTDLADKCTTPFSPAADGADAAAECRTSDLTLAEFQTLAPKMDSANRAATTAEEFQGGNAEWRTTLFNQDATLLTHAESIQLFDSLGADFTPELKAPSVEMPFDGFTYADYADKMIQEYRDAGIDPARVWPQSFDIEIVKHWVDTAGEYGEQAVYLMDQYEGETFSAMDEANWPNTMDELKDMGINYIAPPLFMLVTVEDGELVPSTLAKKAKEADLGIITWSLERSGPLANGGGWYFSGLDSVIDTDGDYFTLLDALAQKVGVQGVFADWPATVTYYANCKGL
ncbi:glycerophosphoryl diester phosphodiesterase [Sagittula marina]|uniref:glycerophosphodiester phosphodiesterase n=1 Tax=Sagittula marina TaxID=943940 RepID=A0A7W6GR80_9RHOB|nr:glycerophosphodiester phosphodiesterase family protein [Sagittula marina]MBB3985126.1 glycerophosphoryl diester phosphodiesterase [Sagittula marina]